MKTAMQELIENIDTIVRLLPNEALGAKNQALIIRDKAYSLLEKEKQQILSANNAGWKVCNRRYNQNAEDYFKETFSDSNQAGI
jgi:ElaB/YqjD/DUF883 family membrane-anchored ribosome-binding protein